MPTLQIDLKQFLELIWGYKDRSVLSTKEHSEILKQLYFFQDESFFHIEKSPDEKLYTIWRAADWHTTEQKFLRDKQRAEERLVEHEKQKALVLYLRELIVSKLGIEAAKIMDVDNLVANIITTKNKAAALMFGASEERLEWP